LVPHATAVARCRPMVSCPAVRLNDPLQLLFRTPFDPRNFPDTFYPIAAAAAILLVLAIVFYNVQTRRYHRHPPLLALQEWLLWTAVVMFGLLLIEATFKFYFFTVLLTIVIGIAVFIWIRFFLFPPQIEAYNQQLRRARSQSQQRFRSPEATIRTRRAAPRSRRRR
jgi:hypothetical protein